MVFLQIRQLPSLFTDDGVKILPSIAGDCRLDILPDSVIFCNGPRTLKNFFSKN